MTTAALKCLHGLAEGRKCCSVVQTKFSLWSDERLFTIKAVVTFQDDRVYTASPGNISEGVRTHFKREKPTGILVCVGDSSKSAIGVHLKKERT